MNAMASTAAATTMPAPDADQGFGATGPHRSSGSVAPFFGVLAMIMVLTVVSCIIGRACRSQVEGPDARYDCTKCGWPGSRWARGRLRGGSGVVREAKAAVAAAESESKEGKQLALELPQP